MCVRACMHACVCVCLVGAGGGGGGGWHFAVQSDKPCSLLTSTAFGLLSVCLCVSSTYFTFPPVTKLGGILESLCPCVQLYPDDIFWTAQPFITKLSMVVHHWLECHMKEMGCYRQGQGHSEGLYNQNMTVSTISSKLMILLQPDLVWW